MASHPTDRRRHPASPPDFAAEPALSNAHAHTGAHTAARPVVWSIAGSDSGAGAGLQADLRAFDAMEVLGCTAVAAITAQNSVALTRVEPVATGLLAAQLETLAADLPPRAIKTGLLGSADNIRCVAAWVDRLRRDGPVALVVDPLWRASTGSDLASDALRRVLLRELLPRASVITPNRHEAAWLLGWPIAQLDDAQQVEQAGAALRALGPQAVVITGGDAGGERSLDWLDTPQARGWLALPRVATPHHHGSGCVFAATLAAAMAHGFCHADAAVLAKMGTAWALHEAALAGSGGQGAGAARPARGFALRSELLPSLHACAADALAETATPPFAPLAARWMGLYAVVDSAAWVERVLAAGARTVQLRIKQGAADTLSAEVARSVQAARASGAQLFINDHWQLALQHGAYGVHLGQEDLATADLPALQAAGLRLGVSTHSYWEVCRAHGLRPSYIACGPIHPTTTKAMPWLPQGEGNLAYWCRLLQTPVVAIAGMDAERGASAVRCGAAGVAVLRGIVQATDPAGAVALLSNAIEAGSGLPRIAPPSMARPTLSAGALEIR